jgi:predicted DNA-binding protein
MSNRIGKLFTLPLDIAARIEAESKSTGVPQSRIVEQALEARWETQDRQ